MNHVHHMMIVIQDYSVGSQVKLINLNSARKLLLLEVDVKMILGLTHNVQLTLYVRLKVERLLESVSICLTRLLELGILLIQGNVKLEL
jgi:hypothetical protein